MEYLAHFNKAKYELALATKIDEVKEIRDRAEALRVYARQAGEGLVMQNQCAEIKIRAERRGGELIEEQGRKPGETDKSIMSHDVTLSKPKLEELGIDRKQSSRWQQIASIPEEKFEEHIAEIKDQNEELTSRELLTVARNMKRQQDREEQPFEPRIELYNIWNFAKRDVQYTDPIFGSQTAELIFNLLYYYTDEGDLIFDAFAGSGLVNDVCQKMSRQCYSTDLTSQRDFIKELDVTKELPDIEPDFIFLDPPYWKQARGKYSNNSDDLANMPLDRFYQSFDTLFDNLDQTYGNFILALLIANTQWPNNRKVEPHALKLFEKLSGHFNFEHHIIVPYSTEQYNGTQVEIAKKEKLILTLHRDLLVFRK